MKNQVIVVGAGLAGLSATITLAEAGKKVVLISSLKAERVQSVMAEGGINAALDTKGEADSPEQHLVDTLAGGCDLADAQAVRGLVQSAPGIVRWLADLGVVFNRDENGELDLRNFGGQKKKRTAFARSGTGKQIVTALTQAVQKYESEGLVEVHHQHCFVRLVQDAESTCLGCVVMDKYSDELSSFTGEAVIIASGGFHGIFGRTTGSVRNYGAVSAALFRAGVPMANLEFTQYHPTTGNNVGKRMLITEATRGEGGRLFVFREDGSKRYFMEEKYPELGNLMPRDVVARNIWQFNNHPKGRQEVYLDLTHLSDEVLEKKLADTVEDCKQYFRLDPKTDYIPVEPGLHYFMGGIHVDRGHRAGLKGLYAAGECCCQYHGANRLGGNSLLGAIYGWITAAQSVIADGNELPSDVASHVTHTLREIEEDIHILTKHAKTNTPLPVLIIQFSQAMYGSLGVIRSGERLNAGIAKVNALISEQVQENYDPTSGLYDNLMLLYRFLFGRAVMESALNRQESRGAHYRVDFQNRDDGHFQKTSIIRFVDGEVVVSLEEIS